MSDSEHEEEVVRRVGSLYRWTPFLIFVRVVASEQTYSVLYEGEEKAYSWLAKDGKAKSKH